MIAACRHVEMQRGLASPADVREANLLDMDVDFLRAVLIHERDRDAVVGFVPEVRRVGDHVRGGNRELPGLAVARLLRRVPDDKDVQHVAPSPLPQHRKAFADVLGKR